MCESVVLIGGGGLVLANRLEFSGEVLSLYWSVSKSSRELAAKLKCSLQLNQDLQSSKGEASMIEQGGDSVVSLELLSLICGTNCTEMGAGTLRGGVGHRLMSKELPQLSLWCGYGVGWSVGDIGGEQAFLFLPCNVDDLVISSCVVIYVYYVPFTFKYQHINTPHETFFGEVRVHMVSAEFHHPTWIYWHPQEGCQEIAVAAV
jgi:hypothetical protein